MLPTKALICSVYKKYAIQPNGDYIYKTKNTVILIIMFEMDLWDLLDRQGIHMKISIDHFCASYFQHYYISRYVNNTSQ